MILVFNGQICRQIIEKVVSFILNYYYQSKWAINFNEIGHLEKVPYQAKYISMANLA